MTTMNEIVAELDALIAEYEAWQKQQGLKLGWTDEGILFDGNLTDAQRTWLRDFSQRWESASRVHRLLRSAFRERKLRSQL
jgi:hypothetical protein